MKNQIRKRILRILIFAVVFMLGGCNDKGEDSDGVRKSSEFSFLDEEISTWEDNKLDDLHAVINLRIRKLQPVEGEITGGRASFPCETGCVNIRDHITETGCWSDVYLLNFEGEEKSFTINPDAGRELDGCKFGLIGSKAGERGFSACNALNWGEESEALVFEFCELDESFQVIKSVQAELRFLDRNMYPHEVMTDEKGNYHLIYSDANYQKKYAVISSDGKVLLKDAGKKEGSEKYDYKLCPSEGGRVVLGVYLMPSATEWWFYEADLETGILQELPVSKDENIRKKMSNNSKVVTAIDDYRLAWCTSEGVYVCDSRSGDKKLAYKWSNHGIIMPFVKNLVSMKGNRIGILYVKGDEEEYLLLQETGEKSEIKSITFAVSTENKTAYQTAAAYFNKRFPIYNVDVTDEWDETNLLTRLGAGEGPVLVDTALTGFEELERFWQPLDGFLEQTGLSEELMPEALNFGKIGDVQYGLVRSFTIHTLIVSDTGTDNWDYGDFLRALENKEGVAPFSCWYIETPTDWRKLYFDVLCNGLEDSYYLNLEKKDTIFGTAEFDRVLNLSERARKCLPANSGEAIKDNLALCEVFDVWGFQQLVELRLRMEANGEHAIGYPTKEGAKHRLVASSPVVMRMTATEEEKKIAYTFLKLFLSKESILQSCESGFYVRNDTLEEQLANYEISVNKGGALFNMPPADTDKDMTLLRNLINKGIPQKAFPQSLEKVFAEEIGDYLSGMIDGKALADHLKSRVTLYLQENW